MMIDIKNYRKFQIPCNSDDKGKILINLPQMCPICERRDIGGHYKYKLKRQKHLLIPLCEEHYEVIENNPSVVKICVIPFLIILLTFIPSVFISTVTKIFWILTIVLLVDIIFFTLYFLKGVFNKAKANILIGEMRDYIGIGIVKESIIFRIKRPDWARLFESLNQCQEIKYDISEIKRLKKNIQNWLIILGIWIGINVPLIVILSIYIDIKIIGYFLIVFATYLIISIFIFNYLKIKEIETVPISLGGKICFGLLLIFILLLITLGWFRS